MKTGAFILALLFLVLSIEPVFINWGSSTSCASTTIPEKANLQTADCNKSCTAATKTTTAKNPAKKPVKQAEGPCNTCNPFMVCNACAYIPGEPQELVQPGIMEVENTNGFNDISLPSFDSDCWHPPELFYHL